VPVVGSILFNIALVFYGLMSEFRHVDIINVNSARPVLGAWMLSWLLRRPLVVTVEIINTGKEHLVDRCSRLFQRLVFSLPFDHIICWSKYYWTNFLAPWGLDQQKVSFIACGVDAKQFAQVGSGRSIRQRFDASTLLIVFAKPLYDYNFRMACLLLEAAAPGHKGAPPAW